MAVPALTIYSARICPWAQRVTLALREVGAYDNKQVEHVEIDLQPRAPLLSTKNKPSWYASKVNPASKVPVIAVGKKGDADQVNIPESGVLLELVADLFPDFTDVVTSAWYQVTMQGKPEAASALLEGVSEIQGLLQRHKGTFLLGDKLSIGDLAVAPFVGRIYTLGKAGLLADEAFSPLASDAKFAPFRDYYQALTTRPSWKETFDDEYIVEKMKARIESTKAQQQQEQK
ncbi:hypothetical protein DMC30DRAFT_418243 [Rhodotorula diobovata]|uniref:GST N-terminal domain-containing protein n=1 Tax=Rhodotorula diobovata TaxID=5288 RepID=A0A5C5FQE2_9BASI|nr:hypothetical protein DMC30DRAFT_418243 [Rhodotorula diobovata]